MIIFTTDNGAGKLGKGKLTSEDGFRVPLILNNPMYDRYKAKMEYFERKIDSITK